jgi:hypothetical protein
MRLVRAVADDLRELACLIQRWWRREPVSPREDEILQWLLDQDRRSQRELDFLERVFLNRENRP